MTVEVAQRVLSCGELSVGDKIEAWHNGKLFHRGEVIRTVAATDLFWILDGRTGLRRLIDAEVLVIRRAAAPAAKPDPAAPAAPAAPESPATAGARGAGARGAGVARAAVPGPQPGVLSRGNGAGAAG